MKPYLLVCAWMLGWVMATGQYKTRLTVAPDSSGDFTSIQRAIDAAKAFPDERIVIYIRNGVYHEKIKVHAWNTQLTLLGENRDSVIIRHDDHFQKIDRGRNSTFHTYTLLVDAHDFRAENLTIQNTSGPVGQAIALAVEADRCAFVNCRIAGYQDTLYTSGEGNRQYFKNCIISGSTDFIFGSATAVFDGCTLHSLTNSYITAASTPAGQAFGLVFLDCHLTAGENVKSTYLGRPWRSHARTVFIGCHMGRHIRPEGWHDWNKAEAQNTTCYAEYDNRGPGFTPEKRVKWAHLLSGAEVESYRLDVIFKGWHISE